VIALCPTCHRRVHHGEGGAEYNAELKEKLLELEPTEQTAVA
jgi:5-methylcytosine-specific restriction protein A